MKPSGSSHIRYVPI